MPGDHSRSYKGSKTGAVPSWADEYSPSTMEVLGGYPWLPCPLCKGVEGCDHTVPERARAAGYNLPIIGLPSYN